VTVSSSPVEHVHVVFTSFAYLPQKMKALVLEDYNRLEYKDVPDPLVGPDDVLIDVKACGICGSDVHGMDGNSGRRQPPIIMGHEAAGVISDLGSNVTEWKKGDRVTFDSTIYCGGCHFCKLGQINLCDNRRVLGVSCDQYRRHGAFAQYVVVPQHILYRLPDELTFTREAMVESLSIAYHAVNRTTVLPNDTAVVVGTGMIGLLVIQVLRAAGCGDIIAVDIDADRLELAEKLGADLGLKSDDCNVTDEVIERTEGRGADLAFEAVGITPTIQAALSSLRKGGSLTMIGNLSANVEMPLQKIVTGQITLYGSCASCGQYPACLDMIARGAIDVDSLISATAPLSEGALWFKRLYDREKGLMRVILIP